MFAVKVTTTITIGVSGAVVIAIGIRLSETFTVLGGLSKVC